MLTPHVAPNYSASGTAKRMHQLGYRKMPERMYQNWLNNMKSEERDNVYGSEKINSTATQTNEHSPFVPYGYDKPIVFTASRGMFEEFHDFLDTVEIGNILFDCRNNMITGFIPEEKIEVRADILPLSVDPHADRYWWITPYAYCNNNPIIMKDPDGRDIIKVHGDGSVTIKERAGRDVLKSTETGKRTKLSGNGVFRAAYSTEKDDDGNKTTTLSGLSKDDAKTVFNFMGDNTSVEWGYLEATNSGGGIDHIVGSSHEERKESHISDMTYRLEEGSVQKYDHSHPSLGFGDANGYRYSKEDERLWDDINKNHPNASIGIRFQGKYDLYYKSGNKTDKYGNPAYKYK